MNVGGGEGVDGVSTFTYVIGPCLRLLLFTVSLLTHLLTYLLTPWSTILLENVTGSQVVKNFPTFYGTRMFITAFTRARHLSLS